MPASKAKSLSCLFRSAAKTSATATVTATKSPTPVSSAEDTTLKRFLLSLDVLPSTADSTSQSAPKDTLNPKPPSGSKKTALRTSSNLRVQRLEQDAGMPSECAAKLLSEEISTILCGDRASDSELTKDGKSIESVLDVPWFSSVSHNNISLRRKEISRERKQKWVFKNTQTNRFGRLVRMCADKLGTDATIQVFGKLGREAGVKEYKALIGLCIEKARSTNDEEVSLQQIYRAFELFKSMREEGFALEDQTYGPFLMYLIDMAMMEEFHFFCGIIKDSSPSSVSRLGYYEMLLWIRNANEEKIQELCNRVTIEDGGDETHIRENYLLALCESDRKVETLQLLEIIDITKVSSSDYMASIFKSLGRLLLEPIAEKFILALKTSDCGVENISCFIFYYATSVPNLAVEDAILKFKHLHATVEVKPSFVSYEKLIAYCCCSLKVHAALDIVGFMREEKSMLSIETFNSILHACEQISEFNLVHQIYSLIRHHNLNPTIETFRTMITLRVKMKDFIGAYGLLNDLKEMNLIPSAGVYNAIMLGYFREKNIHGGFNVLKQMRCAGVKPDSQTFSYLISNCCSEEDIIKYYDELKGNGVQVTKYIYMALINAYAACGLFEKAKQVASDKGVPVKSLNEIKSVLVSALASHGKMSDALDIHEEIKYTGCDMEPKAIISLIEYQQSDGELSRLLQLLHELNDPDYWADGCCRVILYCVQYNHLSSAVDLLKQLRDKFSNDELAIEVIFDELFSLIAEKGATHLQFGLDLLEAIKKDLGLQPSRKCLDFLLTACINAKDLLTSQLIWKEYQSIGLPYNVLSFLRMYQALSAAGDHKSAKTMLKKIPKDDPHVRRVIKACQTAYVKSKSVEREKKVVEKQ